MSLLKLNTVSYVFYFQIITSALVGSVLLASGVIDYHPYAEPLSYATKIEAWMWVLYSILAMPLGMLLLNRICKVDAKERLNEFLRREIHIDGTSVGNNLVLIGMAILSVLTLAYVVYNTEVIPLQTLLEGNPEEATIQRVSAKYDFKGIVYIRSFFGLMLMPVFAYYSYLHLRLRKTPFHLIVFLVCLSATSLLLVLDTQKAPVAFFGMGFFLMEVFITGRINIRKAGIFIGIALLLLLIGYQLTTGASGFDSLTRLNSAFYGRTFLSGYFGFPLSLEFFPDVISDPTYTAGIPKFLRDSEFTESARLIMMRMNPEGVKEGTANLFSSYYLGEAWANYGYLGLLISPFLVGMVIQVVHIWLLKSPKAPLVLAFYGMVTERWLVGAGVVGFLYLKIILFPALLFLLARYVIRRTQLIGA